MSIPNLFSCAYRSMTTRRMAVRRLEEGLQEEAPQGIQVPQDAQVPPQSDQVLIGGEGNHFLAFPPDMTNREIRETLLSLSLAMTTHVPRDIDPSLNYMESIMRSRLR